MSEDFLKNLSFGVIVLSLVLGAIVLIGASFYDYKRAKVPKAKKLRAKRPLVSAIVYSDGSPEMAVICADSVLASSHRKVELIVINNAPNKITNQLFNDWAKKRVKRDVRVINKRRPLSLEKAITSGIKVAKGQILILLNNDLSLEKPALGQAVDKLLTDPSRAVIPEIIIDPNQSTLGLWASFKIMLRANWQKTASLMDPAGGGLHFGVFYHSDSVRDKKSAKHYDFDSQITVKKIPSASLTNLQTPAYATALAPKAKPKSAIEPLINTIGFIYRVFALPIFVWYSLYLALNRGYSYLLFLSFSVFIFVYLVVVWTQAGFATRLKAELSALSPAVFSLALIMVFVEAVSKIFKILRLNSALARKI